MRHGECPPAGPAGETVQRLLYLDTQNIDDRGDCDQSSNLSTFLALIKYESVDKLNIIQQGKNVSLSFGEPVLCLLLLW